MPHDVTMPKLTDSMEEGRIVEWRVAVGAEVKEGDVLAEIETDKAVMELESFRNGTVQELLHEDGEVVAVGEVVARIGEGAEDGSSESARPTGEREPTEQQPERPSTEETESETESAEEGEEPEQAEQAEQPEEDRAPAEKPEETKKPAPGGSKATPTGEERSTGELPIPGGHPVSERDGERSPRPKPVSAPTSMPGKEGRPKPSGGVRASPRARRRALELEVDLASVAPTGGEGQVTVEDVERETRGNGKKAAASVPSPARADRADEELPAIEFDPDEAEVEEVSFYQKAVIRRVVASKHVIPHFYVTKAVRADELLRRWRDEKDATGATLTHYIMRACARALKKYPQANRSYDRGRWIRWKVVHLGLAVQTDAGLVVAVLRDAGNADLGATASRTKELVERARAGKLSPPERSNPTFTISNLGAHDVESFSAIINPPSALTLAVGSAVETPVVRDGKVEVGTVMHLTLSCDHRVVDGVLAARFLGEIKRLLEEPSEL